MPARVGFEGEKCGANMMPQPMFLFRKQSNGEADVFGGGASGFGNSENGRIIQFAAVLLLKPLGEQEHLPDVVVRHLRSYFGDTTLQHLAPEGSECT